MREISCENAYSGQNGLLAHFGLGDATNVTTLRIEWPSGLVQEFTDVPTKQILTIAEHQAGVTTTPSLTASKASGGPVQLTLTGQTNLLYVFEASTNLVQWTKIAVRTNLTGTVDMGAYECQSPALLDYYTWLQNYGLPTDTSAAYADSDGDRLNNWQEWRCRTDPTNPFSVLRLLSASPAGTNVTVSWQSVAGVSYVLERSTDLGVSPPFTLLATGIPGQPGTTTFTDTNAPRPGPAFYRIGTQP